MFIVFHFIMFGKIEEWLYDDTNTVSFVFSWFPPGLMKTGWTWGLIPSGFIFSFFVLIYPRGAELKYLFSSDWMRAHVSHVGPETFNQSSNQAVEPQLWWCEGSSFNLRPSPWTRWHVEIMTLQLRTKPGLWDLHCSVGLTDWDMDKELKLATTSDQFLHGDSSPPPCQS